jgi:hypothetical protein
MPAAFYPRKIPGTHFYFLPGVLADIGPQSTGKQIQESRELFRSTNVTQHFIWKKSLGDTIRWEDNIKMSLIEKVMRM